MEQRGSEVLRAQALPNDAVNLFWNCDKGRYGHRFVSSPDRLLSPLVRRRGSDGNDAFAGASWKDALDEVAGALRAAIEEHGPASVGFIGGAHATNMTIVPQRELVLVFLVQHAGFPGNGSQSFGAFKKAAEEKFGKAKN